MKAQRHFHRRSFLAVFLVLLLHSVPVSAQWYGRLGGGYAGQAGKDHIKGFAVSFSSQLLGPLPEGFIENNNVNQGYRYKTGSYGQGLNVHAGVGYMFGKHVGAELEVGYAISDQIKSKFRRMNNNVVILAFNPELRAKTVFITPSLVLSAGTGTIINPYARMGLLLGLPKVENSDLILIQVQKVDYKGYYYGGLMTGFSGALGLSADLSKHIAVYGEVRMTAASYRPKKWKVEVLKFGNASYKLEGKELELKKRVTGQDDPDQVQQTFSNPFGSVGFNTGVLFKF